MCRIVSVLCRSLERTSNQVVATRWCCQSPRESVPDRRTSLQQSRDGIAAADQVARNKYSGRRLGRSIRTEGSLLLVEVAAVFDTCFAMVQISACSRFQPQMYSSH